MRERHSDSGPRAGRVPRTDPELAALLPDGPSITVKQAASLLSIDISSVYKAVHRGELRGHRVGKRAVRIYLNSVDAYRQAREIHPPAPTPAPTRRASARQPSAAHLEAVRFLDSLGA